ncbi:MAG: glutamate mutase L [Bacillota bacterium]|jgi:hypothetical protein
MSGTPDAPVFIVDGGNGFLRGILLECQSGVWRLAGEPVTISPSGGAVVQRVAALIARLLTDDLDGQSDGTGRPRFVPLSLISGFRPLRLVAWGRTTDSTRRWAAQAVQGTACWLVDVLAADDGRQQGELISRLVQLQPDVLLLFGGLEGGAQGWLHPVLAAISAAGLGAATSVVYVGDSQAATLVANALHPKRILYILPNMQQESGYPRFDAVRTTLASLWEEWTLGQDQAQQLLSQWEGRLILTAPRSLSHSLAAYAGLGEQVLLARLDAASCMIISYRQLRLISTIAPWGLGDSLLLAAGRLPVTRLSRWLDGAVSGSDWFDLCLNRSCGIGAALSPCCLTRWESAVAQEVLYLAAADHQELHPEQFAPPKPPPLRWWEKLNPEPRVARYCDRVIGTGPILAGASAEQAASWLADGLQPHGVVSIYRDRWDVWPLLGVLEAWQPGSIAAVLADSLELLTTIIRPTGLPASGRKALTVRLPGSGEQSHVIRSGERVLLPHTRHRAGVVELRPQPGVDLGAGTGVPVERPLSGGTLGLIVDCRAGESRRQRRQPGRHEPFLPAKRGGGR